MSETKKAAPPAYVSTREIVSSPRWRVLCVLLCLLAAAALLNLWTPNASLARKTIDEGKAQMVQLQAAYDEAKASYDKNPSVPPIKQAYEKAAQALEEAQSGSASGSVFTETVRTAFGAEHLAPTVVSLILIILFIVTAVFAWMAGTGNRTGLRGLRCACLIACGISVLYTVIAVIFLAYILIENCVTSWEVFALRRSFTIFTALASLAVTMFLLKACRVLNLMLRRGQVANEAPLRFNAILAAIAGGITVLGILGLSIPFGSTASSAIFRINFAEQLQLIDLPAWYTGFTYYQGGFWEFMQVVLTYAVIICGGLCI